MLALRHLRNSKGQVALFVALMFQVLFVFFAMIVNVGLLVHHKINLQNSVDLAAYYGAMKQAESLNAIAHVNYQIRQSWKLLTFRYVQLGTAGTVASTTNKNPYTNNPGRILREDDKPIDFDPAFCIAYAPWDMVTQSESYCKEPQGLSVDLPGVPNFGPSSPFAAFQSGIIAVAQELRAKSRKYCAYSMSMNWLTLAKFISAYKYDVRNRKKLLLAMANELSKDDPRDIQGDSIKEGVYKTLIRNLTYPNQEGLKARFGDKGIGQGGQEVDFQFVNSLSQGDCRGNPTDVSPPGWLKEVFIFPVYGMVDGSCDESTTITFNPSYFNVSATPSVTQNIPRHFPELLQIANQLAQDASEFSSSDPNQLLFRSTIGFEKNPWCVGYVGVSAKTTPKIPFSPMGSVTMKATAFAKPFGGRIGPWYGSVWPSGADQSDISKPTDAILPTRIQPQIQMTGFNPAQLQQQRRIFPNHSRYMGDKIGVMSELTVAHFAQAIHQRLSSPGQPQSLFLRYWDQLQEQDYDVKTVMGDALAWDKNLNQAPLMRNLEIAAIAPDQYDTANYSIDPDFYNNYLRKIEQGYGNSMNFLLRGDLGSRMQGSPADKRFSIRNQIEVLKDATKPILDWNTKLTYYLNDFAQLLTSWQQKSPDEYVIDQNRFGKCLDNSNAVKQDEEKFFTKGSCKVGGRTGYSVKIVDGKFLRNEVNGVPQDFELGGKNQNGRIRNPPPDNF
jgi:hypothetical protein